MSPEQYKPGPELDALVAERVMGWERTTDTLGEIAMVSSFRATAWRRPGGSLIAEQYIPPYSTDISAAWELVEKLTSEGRYFILSGPDGGVKAWRCQFNTSFHPTPGAKSVPHAIALAALKAVQNV